MITEQWRFLAADEVHSYPEYEVPHEYSLSIHIFFISRNVFKLVAVVITIMLCGRFMEFL
jgi:hypothetical protein